MNFYKRTKSRFLKVAGYLIPLVQSVPAWTGLMTLPFAGYLLLLFINLPNSLFQAVSDLLLPFPILEKTLIYSGLSILLYSTVYLSRKKSLGLITSGPYRWVRHPQYLGMIVSTLGFTGWSIWILKNTFGVGFLNPSQTVGLWCLELFAYVTIAYIEERDLSQKYVQSFDNYKRRVPFLIPFLKSSKENLNILLSILLPVLVLFGLIFWSP